MSEQSGYDADGNLVRPSKDGPGFMPGAEELGRSKRLEHPFPELACAAFRPAVDWRSPSNELSIYSKGFMVSVPRIQGELP